MYLLPDGCNTFVLNDAVGNAAFPFPCTVVNNILTVSPALRFTTLKNVLPVTKQVKKFPSLPSIDAVADAILADTILPTAEPVTMIEPDIIAEPVNGNVDAPPAIVIDAVLEVTAAVTPVPVKFKNVAVPCEVPSSAIVMVDMLVVTPDVPDVPATPFTPEVPEIPDVPEVPLVPAVTLEPETTYIVFASVCPAVIKLANEAELKVTMLVTAGTFVYISYMLDTKLPLNPPTNCDIEPVTPKLPVICAEPVKGKPAPLTPEVPDVPLVDVNPLVPDVPVNPLVPDVPLLPSAPVRPLVPDVPLVPFKPFAPLLPLVPLVPLVPEVPDVPLLPDEPFRPFAPLLPLVPDVPLLPATPLIPLVPEVPEEPFKPFAPLLPLVPEVPDEPFVPFMPDVPDVPEVPDVPLLPEEPELPEVPDVPSTPLVPFVPFIPEVPDVPLVPLVPEVPEEPSTPFVPLVPLLPLLPDEPLLPLEPDVPPVPLIPLVPDVPAVPEVPNGNCAIINNNSSLLPNE